MQYILDYDGKNIHVPEQLRNWAQVRYVQTFAQCSQNIADLYYYLAWKAYLHQECSYLAFETTDAFNAWMFEPYSEDDFASSNVEPALPRIALVYAALYDRQELDSIDTTKARQNILHHFTFAYPQLFPHKAWPECLGYMFCPSKENPIPAVLQGLWNSAPTLQKDFPCQTLEEVARFLKWGVFDSPDIFPQGQDIAIKKYLSTAHPLNEHEGLSLLHASFFGSKGYDSKEYSLDTAFERLRYMFAVTLYNPEFSPLPWQWEELHRPNAAMPHLPNIVVGAAAHLVKNKKKKLVSEEELQNNLSYQESALHFYAHYMLPLIKDFSVPSWIYQSLYSLRSENPIPAVLQGLWNNTLKLQKSFPCKTLEEKARFLKWSVYDRDDIFPQGKDIAIKKYLSTAHPLNKHEGLSLLHASFFGSKGYDSKKYSLDTAFGRLRYMFAVTLYNPEFSPLPWQWEELHRPNAAMPHLPNIVVGAAAHFVKNKKKKLVSEEELQSNFSYQDSALHAYAQHILPVIKDFSVPSWIYQALYCPRKENPIPAVLQGLWNNTLKLQKSFPCKTLEEASRFLKWGVFDNSDMVPQGYDIAIKKHLSTAHPLNEHEGLSLLHASFFGSKGYDSNKYSLDTAFDRLHYMFAVILYNPEFPPLPWQWEELHRPNAAMPHLPNIVVGAAAHFVKNDKGKLISEEELQNSRSYQDAALSAYAQHVLPVIKDFSVPSWIYQALYCPRKENSIPAVLQGLWNSAPSLQKDFPCQTVEEIARFLKWGVYDNPDMFPQGQDIAIKKHLSTAHPLNEHEGLSLLHAGFFGSTGYDSKQYSLDTTFDRLRYMFAVLLYNRDLTTMPWQWEELHRPNVAIPHLPNIVVGAAAHFVRNDKGALISEEELQNTVYFQECALSMYAYHILPLIQNFTIPQWILQSLTRVTRTRDDAKALGINVFMNFLPILVENAPNFVGGDEKDFLTWYINNPLHAFDIFFAASWQILAWERMHPELLQQAGERQAFFAKRSSSTITVMGWPTKHGGIGEDARSVFTSVQTHTPSVHCLDISPLVPFDGDRATMEQEPLGLVNIICLAAQDMYRLAQNSAQGFWQGRYNIGLCPWELPTWPKKANFCVEMLDEVWAPSTFVAKAFEKCGKPVTYIPHAVNPITPSGDLRLELGIAASTKVFLMAFDANSSCLRKNPLAGMYAFNKAFADSNDDVCLIIKTMNAHNHQGAWQELIDANRCGHKVLFIDEAYASEKHAKLLNTCDAFVSLHRSEGFGRLLAEIMTLEKLLICSNFGGNTDFATAKTACLVQGKLVDVQKGEYLLWENQQWFEADTSHAAMYMKDFVAHPQKYAPIMKAGKEHILTHHSKEAVGQRIVETLQQRNLL